jgi:PAS domain S-box-containing protein
MLSTRDAGTLVALLGIQLQLVGSLLCLCLGLILRRGIGDRPWMTWWAWSFGAISLAVAALMVRYVVLPSFPLDAQPGQESNLVAILYATYAGAKLLFYFALLAGTWLFVRREPLPRVGIQAGGVLILGVALLFILAPTDLNPLVAWQAGFAVPVFIACGGLLTTLPPARRTRGSRLLAMVCFLLAGLWMLYAPAFLSAGPEGETYMASPFLRWLVGHNSYVDVLFEFLLGFGMILAVLDDVFREAEEARAARLQDVAASEARLGQIIRAASDGIILLDPERRVAHVNPAALEILGCAEAQVLDQPFDRFATLGDPEALWSATAGSARRSPATPPGGYELVGRRGDGTEFPMEISLRAIEDGAPAGYVLIIRDRTQRVRLDEARELMQSQQAQTARLETIGRMVSGVAHELNNPLTAILAFAQDLLLQVQNPTDTEALTTIVQQSQRCRAIVQDLLTFARTKREDRQSITAREIVDRVLPAFQRQAESLRIRLDILVGDELPPVHANPAAMEQVLTNLLSNAFYATGPGGTVAVLARVDGDRLLLIVEDDGPGIPPDVLPRLFEPFFTTKDPGKGTGLGLSVSHGIVEQHEGTLQAGNRTGPAERGARFTVRLPYLDRRAVRRSVPLDLPRSDLVPSPRPAHGSRRRVLIVDDEAPIRVAIRRYLERRDWEVEEAKDGREAIDLLGLAGGDAAAHAARYDAIVTDLRMPGVSGIEIHDRLAAAAPEALAKLVVISGDTASAEVAEFLARIRQPVVQKPFDMRALADLLDQTAPPSGTPAAP